MTQPLSPSDTPRTDAHCEEIGGDDGLCYAEFARDLERALTAAQTELAKAKERCGELENDAARLAFIEQTLLDDAGSGLEVYPLGAEMDDAFEKVTKWIVFSYDNEGATFREAIDIAVRNAAASGPKEG